MSGGGARLRRSSRLRASKDFQRVSREGTRRASAHFVAVVGRQPPGAQAEAPLLGVTVSRRVGTAVQRNRVKRRIREWFRHNRDALPSDAALVVIARAGAAELAAAAADRELGSLVQ